MMEQTGKNIRFLSLMGSRGAFGQAILDLADDGMDFFATSADLLRASGYDRFIEKYPDRVMNIGIAEQSLIGVSAGLSRGGMPVVATTYAPFATGRCTDQMKNYMGYMGANVKVIGLDGGMLQSEFGASHFGLEDISIARAIPKIRVICPADGWSIYQLTGAALRSEGPVYLRLTGPGSSRLPMVYGRTVRLLKLARPCRSARAPMWPL